MTVARILYAVVAALLIGGSTLAKGTTYRSEDRFNPQHIQSLPPEIRASIEHQCDLPRALHDFAAYSDDRIVLHYEHFYCQGRDVFCNASGCLHQVYVSSGGHYRLQRSYYAPN